METDSRLTWSYDNVSVWGASKSQSFYLLSPYWILVTPTSGGPTWYSGSPPRYEAWAFGQYHSDGFPYSWMPDVEHWQQATTKGYAGGCSHCTFWYNWSGAANYPNLHTHNACWLNF